MKKKVLFHRHYRKFQGGHLAFWHYYLFLKESEKYQPQIYFSNESLWDSTNPWIRDQRSALKEWAPEKADLLVLGSMDWKMLTPEQRENPPKPVINPVLNARQADPSVPVYPYLLHRAIRICPSQETADAIRATGRVNGPIFVIPHGISDKLPAPKSFEEKNIDILIAGLKKPDEAAKLRDLLPDGLKIETLTTFLPREQFLELLSRSKIAFFLPNEREGCYFPILEGMALGCLVISASFIGKHEAIRPGWNCIFTERSVDRMRDALLEALNLPEAEKKRLLENARESVEAYPIQKERDLFLEIMGHVDQIW